MLFVPAFVSADGAPPAFVMEGGLEVVGPGGADLPTRPSALRITSSLANYATYHELLWNPRYRS